MLQQRLPLKGRVASHLDPRAPQASSPETQRYIYIYKCIYATQVWTKSQVASSRSPNFWDGFLPRLQGTQKATLRSLNPEVEFLKGHEICEYMYLYVHVYIYITYTYACTFPYAFLKACWAHCAGLVPGKGTEALGSQQTPRAVLAIVSLPCGLGAPRPYKHQRILHVGSIQLSRRNLQQSRPGSRGRGFGR